MKQPMHFPPSPERGPELRNGNRPSAWCNSGWKRAFDVMGALALVLAASPVMFLIAALVKLGSSGPVFYRQSRPGRNGNEFHILKFRTMHHGRKENGPVLTRAGDPRLTRFGSFLRRCKLDELPQLFNVLRGDMSFVGPRPQPTVLWKHLGEVPFVWSVRPGITGPATLKYCDEEEMLESIPEEKVQDVYLEHIMPIKLSIDSEYLCQASLRTDLAVLAKTAMRIFVRNGSDGAIVGPTHLKEKPEASRLSIAPEDSLP